MARAALPNPINVCSIFYVSKQWCGCQCSGFLMSAVMLMHRIAHVGCTDIVKESALEADSGRKIACHARDLNPCHHLTGFSAATPDNSSQSQHCMRLPLASYKPVTFFSLSTQDEHGKPEECSELGDEGSSPRIHFQCRLSNSVHIAPVCSDVHKAPVRMQPHASTPVCTLKSQILGAIPLFGHSKQLHILI